MPRSRRGSRSRSLRTMRLETQQRRYFERQLRKARHQAWLEPISIVCSALAALVLIVMFVARLTGHREAVASPPLLMVTSQPRHWVASNQSCLPRSGASKVGSGASTCRSWRTSWFAMLNRCGRR